MKNGSRILGEAGKYTLSKLGPIARYKSDCLYGSTVVDWRITANLLVQEAEHEENRGNNEELCGLFG